MGQYCSTNRYSVDTGADTALNTSGNNETQQTIVRLTLNKMNTQRFDDCNDCTDITIDDCNDCNEYSEVRKGEDDILFKNNQECQHVAPERHWIRTCAKVSIVLVFVLAIVGVLVVKFAFGLF